MAAVRIIAEDESHAVAGKARGLRYGTSIRPIAGAHVVLQQLKERLRHRTGASIANRLAIPCHDRGHSYGTSEKEHLARAASLAHGDVAHLYSGQQASA